MIQKLLFSVILWLLHFNLQSQAIDTFLRKLDHIKDDTSKVNEMVVYAKSILYTDPGKAINYCNKAIDLATKKNYQYGLANAYRLAGAYNNDITSDYKKADDYFSKAFNIYKTNTTYRFKEGRGAVMHSYGALYQRQGDYVKAIECYVEASKILDSIKNTQILPRTYNNLATLYAFLKLYEKEEYYSRAGIQLARENNDMYLVSVLSTTLSSSLINQGKYEKVLPFLKTADSIAKSRNDLYIQLLANVNYSNYFSFYKKDFNTSISYAKKAYEYAKVLNNPFELTRTTTLLAEQYNANQDYDLAKKTALESMEYAINIQSTDFRQRAYYILGLSYLRNGEYKAAAGHLSKAAELKDSVVVEENRQQINFLETQYQKERKEKEIAQLQNEKQISSLIIKRRNIAIFTLIVSLLSLGAIGWITARNFQHKKVLAEKELELQKKRVIEIEKQRQLDATLSVLQGEEAERSRLARDLHDGLGGLLSGVKLSLTSVKGNVLLTQKSIEQFDKALGLLDKSISELRRVAHNMMPEALVKFGMKDAIHDFCNSLKNDKGVSINYQSFGNDSRIDSNIEINIYRIAQELINNSIKHSNATEMLVQLIQEENRVHLTVQDNGKGFDTCLLKKSNGAGFVNIRSRVEAQNGTFEIFSDVDKGTEATVEFKWSTNI